MSGLPGRMAGAVLAVVLSYAEAPAQQACAPRDVVVTQLEARFGETRQGAGLMPDQTVIEIFANVTTGTWTIIRALPDGISCLLAAGSDWQDDPTKHPADRDT